MTEFDMAYHHNVAVKRKKRLIVLMMLDSPTDLYDNDASDTATLRQFLRQYTYIDYMADDWLDKLLYALPLRGLLQNTQTGMNHALEAEEQDGHLQDTDMELLDPSQGEHQPRLILKALLCCCWNKWQGLVRVWE